LSAPVRRPASQGWLNRPTWIGEPPCFFSFLFLLLIIFIDSGVNLPQFYYTREEINETLRAYGISPPPCQSADHRDLGISVASNLDPVSIPVPQTPVHESQPTAAAPAAVSSHMWYFQYLI